MFFLLFDNSRVDDLLVFRFGRFAYLGEMRVGCTVQSMLRSGRSVRILGCEVHSRGRTPHGVRGLKLDVRNVTRDDGLVAPLTGCVD